MRILQQEATPERSGLFDTLQVWISEHSWLLVGVTLATFFGSLIALRFVMARVPSDYFLPPKLRAPPPPRSGWRLLLMVFRNALGSILFLAGVAMLVLPGQGILTLIMGLSLIDFPGRHRLLEKMTRRPRVQKALQFLRDKAGGEPLIFVDSVENSRDPGDAPPR